MTLLSRARSLLQSPADRRLAAAEAEAWSSAAKPSTSLARAAAASPFGPCPRSPGKAPPIDWAAGDRAPGPASFAFTDGYSNHTYQNRAAPQNFEGFDLGRIRNAVAQHRLGIFYDSSTMAVALMSFAPVLAALQQAIARILALPRHVKGGDRGLARLVARELEAAAVPQGSLLPSPYLPPELWGTMAIYMRNMGFCVLQHVDGDPHPVTGIRPRFTRTWEPWAVRRTRSPSKWIAMTETGDVEIRNDGKFTLVIDENEGHLTGAVVALGEPVLGGIVTMCARNGWLDFFGDPKLYATLPEKVPTHGQAGDDFSEAVETIYGPAGRGVLPYGSTLQAVALPGVGASQFREALYDAIALIGMIYLGSGGTMSNEGVYVSPGFFGVQHDLIARPTAAMIRGLNQGHFAPYCDINYALEIEAAKRAGSWKYPILGVDLADPDQDKRIESVVKREQARTDIIDKRRAAGIETTQDDADKLAEDLDLRPVPLLVVRRGAKIEEWHVENKQVAPDETRADLGLDPLPDGSGSVAKLAEERAAGKDKTGPAGQAGDGRSHQAGAGRGTSLSMATHARNVTARVVAYDKDQERADDGKFGSGGGAGGSDKKNDAKPEKASGSGLSGPGSSLAKGADKAASAAEKVASKADARAAAVESKAAEARSKVDAAQAEYDKADADHQAKRDSEEKAHEDEDDRKQSEIDAENKRHEAEDDAHEAEQAKRQDKIDALDAKASDVEDRAFDLREDHADKAAELANEKEHAELAKLPDDEYEAGLDSRLEKAETDRDEADRGARSAQKAVDDAKVKEDAAEPRERDAIEDARLELQRAVVPAENAAARAALTVEYWAEKADDWRALRS